MTDQNQGRADALTHRLTEFDVLLDGYQEALQDGPHKEREDARNELRLAYRTALLAAAAPIDEPKYTQADMERYGKAYADARDARRAVPAPADARDDSLDAKDARYFRWLCAHSDWRFIEALCQKFVAESQVEFYTKLSAEIERRMKHGANKGKKRLSNGSLAFQQAAAEPQAAAREGLTTKEQVELFAADLVKRGELVWGGFRQDAEGQYTIPELTPAVWKLIRALLATPQPEPRAEVTHGDTTMDECMASLLDRLEAAELYADRYRYLRERPLDVVSAGGVFAGKTPDNVVLNGADLDAAVDAARTGASS